VKKPKAPAVKLLVLFYSTYGHIYRMALAIAEGAREVAGVDVVVKRVPETLPPEVLAAMGAVEAQQAFAEVPVATVNDLAEAGARFQGRHVAQIATKPRV
jgi:NAD(P)H dehydrogenase (quinone)